MSGLEEAILGAVGNAASKKAIEWVQSRGPDFSETDWKETAGPVLRQVRASHEQFRTGYQDKNERAQLKKEIRIAGRILRELEYLGQDRGFDADTIKRFSEFADLLAEWHTSAEIELEDEAGSHAECFEELYHKYRESI